MSKEPLRGQRYHRPTGIAGNPIDADTEEQDEDRCAERFYSCLLFMLCIE